MPAQSSFGSPESRAMARAILQEVNGPVLSQDERDCHRLYVGAVYINAAMSPGGWHLEGTAPYAQGREIRQRHSGPVVPAHLNPRVQRDSCASIAFEMAFHREPATGDILRVEDMQRLAFIRSREVEEFIRAWERQLPEMPCPLRVDEGRIFRRIRDSCPPRPRVPADDGFGWQEATDLGAEQEWRRVEQEAFEASAKEHKPAAPHCTAVVFLGVIDGKHRCKPLDDNLNDAVTPEN